MDNSRFDKLLPIGISMASLLLQAGDFAMKATNDKQCDPGLRDTQLYCRAADDGQHQHQVPLPWPLLGLTATSTSSATALSPTNAPVKSTQ